MLKTIGCSLAVVVICACGVSASAELVIDMVTVGNPGNPEDTHGDGHGRVNYAYDIGKCEVTAGQYTAFLNAVAGVDTYGLFNPRMWSSDYGCKIERYAGNGTPGAPFQYRVAEDWADRPVNYISWGDAARFVNWLHNDQPTGSQGLGTTEDGSYFLNEAMSDDALLAVTRKSDATWVIPREDEWYKAAYHKNDGVTGNYFDYPTGSDSVPSNDLVDPDPGNNATYDDGDYTIGSPYYRTEVGAHENSASPYGTFDQGGNVAEWTEAIFYGSTRGSRGGAFCFGEVYLRAAYDTGCVNPTAEGRNFGLRVCRVPEPASIVTLALAGLATLRRR
ncbi:MAG: SUMF1/EgtB/PvdO family nonheme iron enzyme [Phycisphaerae bacterium]